MLNNISEWQNNPIEATRLCFKYLYEINRSTQKSLEFIDKNKATKTELSTGLNTKGDLSDIMQTFNEVAQNMEQRPTKDELDLVIEDKINKEIKKVMTNGDIKINLKKNLIPTAYKNSYLRAKNYSPYASKKNNKKNSKSKSRSRSGSKKSSGSNSFVAKSIKGPNTVYQRSYKSPYKYEPKKR